MMTETENFMALDFKRFCESEQIQRVSEFTTLLKNRRNVEHFSLQPVPVELMEQVILTAGTSPSGANQQPWKYALIHELSIKRAIRSAMETEGEEFYSVVKGQIQPQKSELLEEAPFLIAIFKENFGIKLSENGEVVKVQHYYAHDSAAISIGFLETAMVQAGLSFVIYPPLEALKVILKRPENESPLLLLAVGNPSEGEATLQKAEVYHQIMKRRRNIRDFSSEFFNRQIIEVALEAMQQTPTPFLIQPYHAVLVVEHEIKQEIRKHAESVEKQLYEEKISSAWREALAPLKTNWSKPHLTDAPYLLVVFKAGEEEREVLENGQDMNPSMDFDRSKAKWHGKLEGLKRTSVGIAIGVFLSALHFAGLCSLTYTPSPMAFLRNLLGRPEDETPIIVLPIGYPKENCHVPRIAKKSLQEILIKA